MRAVAALSLCGILLYGIAVLPMAVPQVGLQIEPLTRVARSIVPQNWALFAPDIPALDATTLIHCEDAGAPIDLEAEEVEKGRRARFAPANKAMHAPRVLGFELLEAHHRERRLGDDLRIRTLAYGRAICHHRGYKGLAGVSVRVIDTTHPSDVYFIDVAPKEGR